MIMNQIGTDHKVNLRAQLATLLELVDTDVREGQAAHELEHALFRELLGLGRRLLDDFFTRQGNGDVNETSTVKPDRELKRSAEVHRRRHLGDVIGEIVMKAMKPSKARADKSA